MNGLHERAAICNKDTRRLKLNLSCELLLQRTCEQQHTFASNTGTVHE